MVKKIVKWTAVILAIIVILGVLIGVTYIAVFKRGTDFVAFDKNRLNEVYTSLTVLDNNGVKLNEPLYVHEYKQIPIDALHDYTYNAFVAVEDKRFFSHNGIDYKRVFGAMLHNIKSGGYKEGASTITQQLIKNTHLNNNKTLKRKLNEMMLARELEKNYSKKEILEMYLNTIYFGRNAYGLETAANVYFNKSAKDLTVSESAVLCGMIKAPNTYAPDKDTDKCRSRRNSVLKIMLQNNVIDDTQYNEALNSEITYCPEKLKAEKTYTYHVMKEACKLLNMTPMQLAQSNFIIETYCNSQVQKNLEQLVNADKTLTASNSLADIACVITDNHGGVEACYFRGETAGGKRQVGSAIKPIAVYAPALNERIITQASPVLDEETDFNGYKPTNLGGYNGWTTIKYSVAKSLNVPAVKTLNALGVKTAEKYLAKLGIVGEQNLSLALGNVKDGMDVFTLAEAYGTLANNGECNEVRFIRNIYGENGLVYSREAKGEQVFTPNASYLMTDLLVNTVQNGTAKKLYSPEYQVAAKTGTVGDKNGNSDAIIAGYTTSNSFVVWYSGELENSVTGSSAPSILANRLLNKMYSDVKPNDFAAPDGVEEVLLDADSLYSDQKMLISDNGERFVFEKANKPKEYASKQNYDYVLSSRANGNDITIELPAVEKGIWKLYKVDNGKITELEYKDSKYLETIKCDLEFYAELYDNGKLAYTTPAIKVCYNSAAQSDKPPSIFDYWYWK